MKQMEGRPRILLVSVGGYGQKYLDEAVVHDAGGDVVGVVEIAPDILERFPVLREKGIPVYPGLDAFFAADQADLAVISSPIHLHVEMIRQCLQHGMNVLCEKPLCLSAGETLQLQQEAEKADCFLAVGWQLNYDPAVLRLKADILSGRYGKPLEFACMHAMRRGMKYYSRSNWAGHVQVDGRPVLDSPFMNACAHHFELMTFLLGPGMETAAGIAGVEGELYRGNPHVENYDIAALRFVTNTGVPVSYYTAHPLRTKNLGQKGIGRFQKGTLHWEKGGAFAVATEAGTVVYGKDGETSLLKKLHDAVEACKTGIPPVCGPLAGLSHLTAVQMAQQLPIRNLGADRVEVCEIEGDTCYCTKELEETFVQCFEHRKLPGELGIRFV